MSLDPVETDGTQTARVASRRGGRRDRVVTVMRRGGARNLRTYFVAAFIVLGSLWFAFILNNRPGRRRRPQKAIRPNTDRAAGGVQHPQGSTDSGCPHASDDEDARKNVTKYGKQIGDVFDVSWSFNICFVVFWGFNYFKMAH